MGDPKITTGQGSGQNVGGYLSQPAERVLGLRLSVGQDRDAPPTSYFSHSLEMRFTLPPPNSLGRQMGLWTYSAPALPTELSILSEDQLIEGIPLREGAKIFYNVQDPLRSAVGTLALDFEGLPEGSLVHIDENEDVTYCQLSQNRTIDGRDFEAGTEIWFNEEGRITLWSRYAGENVWEIGIENDEELPEGAVFRYTHEGADTPDFDEVAASYKRLRQAAEIIF